MSNKTSYRPDKSGSRPDKTGYMSDKTGYRPDNTGLVNLEVSFLSSSPNSIERKVSPFNEASEPVVFPYKTGFLEPNQTDSILGGGPFELDPLAPSIKRVPHNFGTASKTQASKNQRKTLIASNSDKWSIFRHFNNRKIKRIKSRMLV